MAIYVYLRVSTDTQDVENQKAWDIGVLQDARDRSGLCP